MTPLTSDETSPLATPGAAVSRGTPIGVLFHDAVEIHIDSATLDQILEFSERDVSRERGGFLLGRVNPGGRSQVIVEHFLPALAARSRAAQITFTHETWAALNRRAELCFPDAK